MMKFVLIFATAIACATASGFVSPLVAAPVPFVAAQSSQVFARNYNGIVAPVHVPVAPAFAPVPAPLPIAPATIPSRFVVPSRVVAPFSPFAAYAPYSPYYNPYASYPRPIFY